MNRPLIHINAAAKLAGVDWNILNALVKEAKLTPVHEYPLHRGTMRLYDRDAVMKLVDGYHAKKVAAAKAKAEKAAAPPMSPPLQHLVDRDAGVHHAVRVLHAEVAVLGETVKENAVAAEKAHTAGLRVLIGEISKLREQMQAIANELGVAQPSGG